MNFETKGPVELFIRPFHVILPIHQAQITDRYGPKPRSLVLVKESTRTRHVYKNNIVK